MDRREDEYNEAEELLRLSEKHFVDGYERGYQAGFEAGVDHSTEYERGWNDAKEESTKISQEWYRYCWGQREPL